MSLSHLLEVGVAAYGGGVEGEAAEQEAEAEQRGPGGHPGIELQTIHQRSNHGEGPYYGLS